MYASGMRPPPRRPVRRRRSARLRAAKRLSLLAGFAALALATELLARRNARREQRVREPLEETLYREVRGDGSPVLLIPGFQGSTRYWGSRLDPLAARRRLIFIDVLGFGRSPWPNIEYTLNDHLQYLRNTLEVENAGGNVTLVAHSFGTILAAHYAARFPTRIDSLVLLGVPVFRDADEARSRLWEMSATAALFSLNPILSRVSCTLMCATRPYLQRIIPMFRHDLEPGVISDGLLHMWSSVDKTLRNVLMGEPIEKALRVVGSKATIIHGRRDRVTSIERVRELATVTGAQLIETNDDHHGYIKDNAGLVMDVVGR